MKNTYILIWIHQVCKVQAVDDGPLILDLCGNTDSNFFALDPKIVPKLGNLRFGNSKTGKTG
jgi:hypothetical protein